MEDIKEDIKDEKRKLNEKIGENLKKALKNAKITQTELSNMLGVSQPTVYKWCNGTFGIDIFYLLKICKILNLHILYFLEGSEIEPVEKPLTSAEIKQLRELLKNQ